MLAAFFHGLFGVAGVLYVTVILSHRVKNTIEPWMVLVFGLGLLADVTATYAVCLYLHPWQTTWHAISGVTTLAIMAAHFMWCCLARKSSQRALVRFHTLSPFAGMFWVCVTVSGFSFSLVKKIAVDCVIIGSCWAIGVIWSAVRQQSSGKNTFEQLRQQY